MRESVTLLIVMLALSEIQWVLIVILVLLHAAACYRIPRWAKLTGRDPKRWFFVTLLFSALPAAVMQLQDFFAHRSRRPGRDTAEGEADKSALSQTRCPHCGARSEAGAAVENNSAATNICPRCGMLIDGEFLA
ncbi:MAG: hypothetical protein ACYSTL_03350 [Planctomycetota bacterium]